jgi:predicted enzyme related to lactoylglutathione lyase
MRSRGVGRLGYVQIDCRDPQRLATFWCVVLGTEVMVVYGDPPQYVNLQPVDGGPIVSMHRVPDPTPGKNRLHLDVLVVDLDAATRQVIDAGGAVGADVTEHGFSWRVMSDPEGNEFCLILTMRDQTPVDHG